MVASRAGVQNAFLNTKVDQVRLEFYFKVEASAYNPLGNSDETGLPKLSHFLGSNPMALNFLPCFRRVFIGTILLMLGVLACAQSTLAPSWMSTGWTNLSNPPQYSWTGTRVLVFSAYEVEVYNATTGAVLNKIEVDGGNGSITSACMNSAGSAVFYATTQGKVYFYRMSNATQTLLSITETTPIRMLTASQNGSTLAYLVTDPVTNNDLVCLYNLSNNTSINRFDFTSPVIGHTRVTTESLGFVNGDQQVVLSGPTIYDFTGRLIAQVVSPSSPVAVSPDESKVFDYNGLDGMYHAYGSNGLSPLWECSNPIASGTGCTGYGNENGLAVSADGKSVLFAGNDATHWYVASVSVSTGAQLSSYVSAPGVGTYFWLAANPKSNQILFAPASTGATAFLWNLNTATGAGTSVGTFFSGLDANYINNNFTAPLFANFTVGSGSTAIPAFAVAMFGGVTMFNADTGAVLSTFSNIVAEPNQISPSGSDFLSTSSNSVGVFTYPGDVLVASASLPNNLSSQSMAWGGTGAATRFAVTDGTNAYTFSFAGSTLTKLATIPALQGWFKVSPDGTKLAVLTASNGVVTGIAVYSTGTGALLFKIANDSNSYTGIDDVSFTNYSANKIGVHEVTTTTNGGSTYLNEYRVFTIGNNSATLSSKISYTMASPANVGSVQAADGDLSPDGLTVVMGHPAPSTTADPRETGTVRVFSAATGVQILEWDNQFIPDFSDPTTNYFTPTFNFSLDGTTVIWTSQNQLVAASVYAAKVGVALSPSSVPGGTASTGTVTITPTPTVATTVSLASSSASATVPATVTVPANSSTATFTVNTWGVSSAASATISATLLNSISSAVLTVTPPSALGVSFNPSTVTAGTSSIGTVTLNAAAGPAGLVVNLSSANSSVVSVPATVTVPANQTSVTFNANTSQPTATGPVAVTGTAGTVTGSGSLTVTQITVGASFNQASVTGGGAVLLTITISPAAPTGGTVVTLTSSDPSLQPRTTVTIPAGATSVTIGVATNPVLTNTSATLTASVTAGSAIVTGTATESVLAPVLQSATPEVTTLVGGASTYVLVQLSGPAPAGFQLACSSNNVAATIASSCTFTAGHSSAEIPITTTAVTTITMVSITIGGQTFTLTLYP